MRIRGGSGALGELRISDSKLTWFWASRGYGRGRPRCFGLGFMFVIVSLCGGGFRCLGGKPSAVCWRPLRFRGGSSGADGLCA